LSHPYGPAATKPKPGPKKRRRRKAKRRSKSRRPNPRLPNSCGPKPPKCPPPKWAPPPIAPPKCAPPILPPLLPSPRWASAPVVIVAATSATADAATIIILRMKAPPLWRRCNVQDEAGNIAAKLKPERARHIRRNSAARPAQGRIFRMAVSFTDEELNLRLRPSQPPPMHADDDKPRSSPARRQDCRLGVAAADRGRPIGA
jgi:hypothetical protein